MPKKNSKKQKDLEKIWTETNEKIPSDVLGSYTGTPSKKETSSMEGRPVQDADDL